MNVDVLLALSMKATEEMWFRNSMCNTVFEDFPVDSKKFFQYISGVKTKIVCLWPYLQNTVSRTREVTVLNLPNTVQTTEYFPD